MEERLAPLCLVPPATETAWSGKRTELRWHRILRRQHEPVTTELPLFWYDPPWHRLHRDLADALAVAVSNVGPLVAALRSEIASPEEEARLCRRDEASGQTPPRIVPYRPERYGLVVEDFDGAAVVDVRMAMGRDRSGRFAYSQARIQRWESTPANEPLAGGSWLPAASFPPDVVSLEQLESKFDQLRLLAPDAAVLASLSPCRLDKELPRILGAKPDGLILRLDGLHLDGLQLAALTRRARRLMDREGTSGLPLWMVPGAIAPADAVKLLALGASAVAIDAWCNPLVRPVLELRTQSGAAFPPSIAMLRPQIERFVERDLVGRLDHFIGYYRSLTRSTPGEQLGSFSASWTKALGVQPLG